MAEQVRTGTVEQLASGRWSVRVTWADGKRRRAHETYATRSEAVRVVKALVRKASGVHRSLAAFGPSWLDQREVRGSRSMPTMRSLWRTWIAPSTVATTSMRLVSPAMVRAWVADVRSKVARQTASNALVLLRRAFAAAVDAELLDTNPALGVSVPGGDARTEDPWTYLEPAEIDAVLHAAGADRALVAFAIGSGLRAGELVALRSADVDLGEHPHVVVRYGGPPSKPTKTGRIRRVPLFGLALQAAEEQVKRGPGELFWPALRGGFRQPNRVLGRNRIPGGYVDRWQIIAEAACIGRHVRWHDLRHTCASACVSGWWGRRWTLEEVKALLGHTDIATTQRYAHLGESALRVAARETAGPAVQAVSRPLTESAPPDRYDRSTFGLGSPGDFQRDRDDGSVPGRLVDAFIAAVQAGHDARARAASTAMAAELLPLVVAAMTPGPTQIRDGLTLADRVARSQGEAGVARILEAVGKERAP